MSICYFNNNNNVCDIPSDKGGCLVYYSNCFNYYYY